MILQASTTIIEFNGDVSVGVNKNGIIAFQDLENTKEPGTKIENDNDIFPVIFKFEKAESIDVLIRQLQKAKEIIQKSKEAE